jgi:putative ABC transport system substrate-binding protein
MKRREFITVVCTAVASFPFAAQAQQATPVVGFLHGASLSYLEQFVDALRSGLGEAGFVEGQNVAIEYRWAEGHYDRLPALAADLASRQVTVILAMGGTDPARAAKAATSTIPIVFVSAADPVQTGLVASLNRPGANVTGVSLIASALDAKKLGILHELVPNASVIAGLTNPKYPGAKGQIEEVRKTAGSLGLKSILLTAGDDDELAAAFTSAKQQGAGALLVASDPFFNSRSARFVTLAAQYSIPTIYPQREYVRGGGLISYGPDFADGYRNAGLYVGKILKGAKPAELPVVQPVKFELVITSRLPRHSASMCPPRCSRPQTS